MRRRFFAFLVWAVCLLVTCTASAAAMVTDVNWGVDKYNVLRMVVDLSETRTILLTLQVTKNCRLKSPADLIPR